MIDMLNRVIKSKFFLIGLLIGLVAAIGIIVLTNPSIHIHWPSKVWFILIALVIISIIFRIPKKK